MLNRMNTVNVNRGLTLPVCICMYIFQTKIDMYSAASRSSPLASVDGCLQWRQHISMDIVAPLMFVTALKFYHKPGGPSDSVEMSSTRCLNECKQLSGFVYWQMIYILATS